MTFKVKSQDVHVLRDVDLEIKENDFNIVFGPSGCGKSTLLHVILGLEAPTAGNITFFERPIYDFSEDDRSEFRKQNVGMIYQQPNWIKSLSVLDNVAFAASISGKNKPEARQKALEMLTLVGMQAWAEYFPTELSSGQQQKVSLARALITDPKVIIADEPTGNLDHKSGVDLMNLFSNLIKQGKTVVVVTHDINMVDYSSVVIQMFDGRIVKLHALDQSSPAAVKKDIMESVYQVDQTKVEQTSSAVTTKPKLTKPSFQHRIFHLRTRLANFVRGSAQISWFVSILIAFILQELLTWLSQLHHLPQVVAKRFSLASAFFTNRVIPRIDPPRPHSISRVDLISLSLQNMKVKKTRTLITIGGMAIGVGLIVFLVSVGYGLEKMVVSRVARLDEMRHADITMALANNLHINDKSLATFSTIPGVSKVLPVIGVVGKVNFQNSVTDIVVYGVMSDYLKESAIKPVRGTVFADNELVKRLDTSLLTLPAQIGTVAGMMTSSDAVYKAIVRSVEYNIEPDKFIRVRAEPSSGADLIGYTRSVEGVNQANEVYGKRYPDSDAGEVTQDSAGNQLGLWLYTTVPLWEQQDCDLEQAGCELGKFMPLVDENGVQVQQEGYFAQLNLTIKEEAESGSVLGVTTDSQSSATNSANLIDIAALEATPAAENIQTVTLASTNEPRQVIVNRAFLKVLSLDEKDAIDKVISLSFVVTGDLTEANNKIQSEPAEYHIVGVTSDSKSPVVYVPIGDIKSMGVTNYSMTKVVAEKQVGLSKIRKQIEALGFQTTSVVDTVSQIEQLFSSVQLMLGVLGVVALSVAALGMFNTLTVSLLERTREVGMMKAIGMKSMEVRDLFLTESMIMGLFGGIGGLLIGFLSGKLFSLMLTLVAVTKGVGTVDITYIPVQFIIFITVVSITVGILTGIYPSRRATRISALNALRYE